MKLSNYNDGDAARLMLVSSFFRMIVLSNRSLCPSLEFSRKYKKSDKPPLKILKEAFKEGNLEYAKWIIEKNELGAVEDFLPMTGKFGSLEIVQFSIERFAITYENLGEVINETFKNSSVFGHIEVAKWLVEKFNLTEKNIRSMKIIVLHTCIAGRLTILEWLIATFELPSSMIEKILNNYLIFEKVCMHNRLNVAAWLLKTVNLTVGYPNIILILKKACKNNYLEVVEWLVKTFNLTISDIKYNGTFQTACNKGNLKIIEFLMEFSNVNSEDIVDLCNHNVKPLLNACRRGDIEFTQWVAKNFKLTIDDIKNCDALQIACNEGKLKIIEFLMEFFNVNSEDIVGLCNYNKPLLDACWRGDVEFIQWVVKTFKLTNKDIIGNEYERSKNYDTMWFINTFHSCDKNLNKNVFLWAACENGHLEVVKYLSSTFNLRINTVPSWNSRAKKKIVKHKNILNFIKGKYKIDVEYEFEKAKCAYKEGVKTWKFDKRKGAYFVGRHNTNRFTNLGSGYIY